MKRKDEIEKQKELKELYLTLEEEDKILK